MHLKIVQAGDPVLREPARPLTAAEIASAEMQQLIELMRETMRDAPGVGLAAPQIGLPLQLAVIEDVAEIDATERAPVPFHVIANPRLTLGDGDGRFLRGLPQRRRFPGRRPARAHRRRSRRSITTARRSRSRRTAGTPGSSSTRSITSPARSTSTACGRGRFRPPVTLHVTWRASRSPSCSPSSAADARRHARESQYSRMLDEAALKLCQGTVVVRAVHVGTCMP